MQTFQKVSIIKIFLRILNKKIIPPYCYIHTDIRIEWSQKNHQGHIYTHHFHVYDPSFVTA